MRRQLTTERAMIPWVDRIAPRSLGAIRALWREVYSPPRWTTMWQLRLTPMLCLQMEALPASLPPPPPACGR